MRIVSKVEHDEHMRGFVITETDHENCAGCLDCARSAVTSARVTGSVGGSYSIGGASKEYRLHSATVERDEPKTYRIVRMYFDDGLGSQVVKRGLTLQEAKTWCNSPETSSETATSSWARHLTAAYGPWFDGFEEEK